MNSTPGSLYTFKNMGINTIDPKMDLHVKGNVVIENNFGVGWGLNSMKNDNYWGSYFELKGYKMKKFILSTKK